MGKEPRRRVVNVNGDTAVETDAGRTLLHISTFWMTRYHPTAPESAYLGTFLPVTPRAALPERNNRLKFSDFYLCSRPIGAKAAAGLNDLYFLSFAANSSSRANGDVPLISSSLESMYGLISGSTPNWGAKSEVVVRNPFARLL